VADTAHGQMEIAAGRRHDMKEKSISEILLKIFKDEKTQPEGARACNDEELVRRAREKLRSATNRNFSEQEIMCMYRSYKREKGRKE
jgi:hypothetical protein